MKKKTKKRESARLKILRPWSHSLRRKTNPLLILNVLHRKGSLDLSQGRISNESKHGEVLLCYCSIQINWFQV